MRDRTTIPALRDAFRVRRAGSRLVVQDDIRRVRVPIDDLGLKILQELADGPRTPKALCRAVAATRADCFERVQLLNRHLLLDTPRAAEQVTLHAEAAGEPGPWPTADLLTAPLVSPPDLAHGCVACGACCTGTDVGPIPDADVARVREIDWTPHLPEDVTPEDWFQELEDTAGNPITLMGMRDGRCVFLGDNKLCIIHGVAGPQQKPTICRQFPYTFTRTPAGVDVSFSMECRSWWQARTRGQPVAEDEDGMRLLLSQGAPVLDLPVPVPVAHGLDWSLARWLEVRQTMIDRVRAATDVMGVVAGLVEPVRAGLDASLDPHTEAERFATRAGWGIPEGDPRSPAMNFVDACDVLRGAVAEGLGDLAARYTAVHDQAQADRVRRLAWVLDHVLSGNRLDDIASWEHDLEVWRDVALASLYSHEPPRRTDVVFGTSLLVLRIVAGRRLAGLLARTALRARTVEQDVVDSMVALTKMLRGTALRALFRKNRRYLVDLFLFNPGVFVEGTAPHPWRTLT